jgi:hypothetical protein
MNGKTSYNTTSGYLFGLGMNLETNSTANYEFSNNVVSDAQGIFWGMSLPNLGTSLSRGRIFNNQMMNLFVNSFGIFVNNQPGNAMLGSLDVANNLIHTRANGIDIAVLSNATNLGCNLQNNQITGTLSGFFGINVQTNSPGSPTLCTALLNNTANSIQFVNNGGTLLVDLNPGNTGTLTTSGAVDLIANGCSE